MTGSTPILLVEDNELNREMLMRRLTFGPAQEVVIAAGDGQQALDLMMRSEQPAVVLMDMNLPVLDGWSSLPPGSGQTSAIGHIPIIALTAHATEEDRSAERAGGRDATSTPPSRWISRACTEQNRKTDGQLLRTSENTHELTAPTPRCRWSPS